MAYNGWSNYETWNVSLWLNNDEGAYQELVRLQRNADDKEELAEKIEAFARDVWPNNQTPDGAELAKVDWEEIAESEWDEDDHPPKTYDEAAERFKINLRCQRIDSRPDNLSEWDRAARHFKCKLSCGRHSFSLYFSQGSAHTSDPSLSDVISCLVSDASTYDNSRSFEEWASDLGFDADSRKAERSYKAVEKQRNQLERILGKSAYETLLTINE